MTDSEIRKVILENAGTSAFYRGYVSGVDDIEINRETNVVTVKITATDGKPYEIIYPLSEVEFYGNYGRKDWGWRSLDDPANDFDPDLYEGDLADIFTTKYPSDYFSHDVDYYVQLEKAREERWRKIKERWRE